jgi:hypothetical protein
MQRHSWLRCQVVPAAILLFSVAVSGCVELKYSAQNRLNDRVAIRPARAVRSVYFSFSSPPKDRSYAEYFSAAFTAALQKKGFVVVDTASNADIVIKASAVFYKKAQGTFLFVLIVPTYRFNEEYDGIAMTITYKTDKGHCHKKYRAYYRGWLGGDQEIASDLILKAIIKDISPPEA